MAHRGLRGEVMEGGHVPTRCSWLPARLHPSPAAPARAAPTCLWEGAEGWARPGAADRVPVLALVFVAQNLFYRWTTLICSWGKLPIPGLDLSPSCRSDLSRLKQVTLGKQLWKSFWSVMLVTKASLFSSARPMAPTTFFSFSLHPIFFCEVLNYLGYFVCLRRLHLKHQ